MIGFVRPQLQRPRERPPPRGPAAAHLSRYRAAASLAGALGPAAAPLRSRPGTFVALATHLIDLYNIHCPFVFILAYQPVCAHVHCRLRRRMQNTCSPFSVTRSSVPRTSDPVCIQQRPFFDCSDDPGWTRLGLLLNLRAAPRPYVLDPASSGVVETTTSQKKELDCISEQSLRLSHGTWVCEE